MTAGPQKNDVYFWGLCFAPPCSFTPETGKGPRRSKASMHRRRCRTLLPAHFLSQTFPLKGLFPFADDENEFLFAGDFHVDGNGFFMQ